MNLDTFFCGRTKHSREVAEMNDHAFTLFDTPIGRCGIAWTARGVAAVHLPAVREVETRLSLTRRFPSARPEAPPSAVQAAIDGIVALLDGEARDLSAVELDMAAVPPFHRRVYVAARSIGPGSTLSYGEVAARLGEPGAARAVGQALGRNPFAIVVPCHRILAASGKVGGFSAPGGATTKIRLLTIESAGAAVSKGTSLGLFEGDGALGYDAVAAVEHLRTADPALARVIDAVGPFRMRVDRAPTLFLALAQAIVYQQLTGKAAATIFARVRALFPRGHEGPTAEQILRCKDEPLRAAGLSWSKLLSLRDLAERAASGSLPTLAEVHRMENDAILERLTEVRGIGRWTVEMLLMFRLGRPDVLPVDDYGIRKGFGVVFKKGAMPTPAALEARAARWKPYRTVASWYLWRALEASRKTGD
jgi:methylated-DNA-[protein]-cysteine S-methyltransferase